MARLAALLALLGLLTACGGSNEKVNQVSAGYFDTWDAASQSTYIIAPGDKLSVRLPYTPEFNADVLVAPDGSISLDLLGPVHAAGYEPDQLAVELENLFGQDLQAPRVVVQPTDFASQKVFIGGEVETPGLYDLPGRIGVLEAVTIAGGMKTTAAKSKIIIIRRSKLNRPMIRTVDVGSFLKGEALPDDVPLQRFDIVYVPMTTGAKISLFVDQYIRGIIPLNPEFTYAIQ